MLNLLPWIFFTWKEFWRLEPVQFSDEEDGVSSTKKLKHGHQEQSQQDLEELVNFDENSLEDILEDTTWRAVNGLSPSSSMHGGTSGYSDQKLGALDSSFGDVFDGEDVKKAVLMKRESRTDVEHDIDQFETVVGTISVFNDQSGRHNYQILNAHTPKLGPGNQLKNSDWEVINGTAKSKHNKKIFREAVNEEGILEIAATSFEVSSEAMFRDEEFRTPDITEHTKIPRKDSWESITVNSNSSSPNRSVSASYIMSNESQSSEKMDEFGTHAKYHSHHSSFVPRTAAIDETSCDDDDSAVSPKRMLLKAHVMDTNTGYSESPKAVYSDFDKIMHRRKLHTDTMQKVSDVFADLGHRDDKMFAASPHNYQSELWHKVRLAVKSKRYLTFAKDDQ